MISLDKLDMKTLDDMLKEVEAVGRSGYRIIGGVAAIKHGLLVACLGTHMFLFTLLLQLI